MKSWDVRLLTGTYSAEGDKVVVELYGKTKDGKSITIRFSEFRPYFYMTAPPQEVIDELKNDSNVLDVQKCKLKIYYEEKDCAKVVLKYPWLVPDYRRRYAYHSTVFAADIPFHHRFIYDYDLGSCVRVHGDIENTEISKEYCTDIVISAEKFESCEAFKPKLKILSFDIENSIVNETIYTICCVIRNDGKLLNEQITGSETEIINKFAEVVQKHDPDIITGYNIGGYDIPQILKRAKANNIENVLCLGRDFSVPKSSGERFWRLSGRIVVDAWLSIKKTLRPKQETLNYVAKLLLNEEKLDVDRMKIDEEWKKRPDEVVEYCTKDAELALRILEELHTIEKDMDLATVSKLPLDDVTNGRTSSLIDSILIREADKSGTAVPMTRHEKKEDKIEGGYVHDIKAGVFHWVCVLDFKSMYPSIIISNNICFTTLSKDGTIVAPTGAKFLDKSKKSGLLPKILEGLMAERDSIKKKMRESKNKEETEYYEGLQNAVKVLMNAFYGVFASSFYRFTNPIIGASITAFARENIKGVIKMLGEEGLIVMYSDTDSIFFQSPHQNLKDTVEFGQQISKRFSKDGVVLEFEKVLEPFFSHGKKKRYIGKALWPKEDVIIRGYEIRRTDSFDLQSEALSAVFDEILSGREENAVKVARKTIDDIKTGNVPLEKLVISRTAQTEGAYKDPDSLANVRAARKMKELGYEFTPGMKVAYIVTDSKKDHMDIEPYIEGRRFEHTPDWTYYATRVALSLSRVTDVFGWSEKSLLSGVQQKSLFAEWDREKEEENDNENGAGDEDVMADSEVVVKESPIKNENVVKKKMKIDDFM